MCPLFQSLDKRVSVGLSKATKIGFIGSGFVGGSLSVVLSQAGYSVVAASSRTYSSAEALAARVPDCVAYESHQEVVDRTDMVILTTPDDAIGPVSAALAWRSGQGVAHCSGAASLDVLEGAARQGAIVGSFHPMQVFSSVENGVKSIPGIIFGIEGNDEMQEFLSDAASAIGGNPILLNPEDKVLYHVSGVLMGNLLTVLGAVAAQVWDHIGKDRAQGVKALAPMMRQVSINLETSGVPAAVAGPYVRGDIGTINKHLEALTKSIPGLLPLYCELALAGLPYSVEKGAIPQATADEIKELIERFK